MAVPWVFEQLRRWRNPLSSPPGQASLSVERRFRPRVELLEPRNMPATLDLGLMLFADLNGAPNEAASIIAPLKVGDTFWAEVFAKDDRGGGTVGPGVIGLPLNLSWDPTVLQADEADLALTNTVNNTTPNVGDNVVFTLTLNNLGPKNAQNVTVSDPLPAGLTFVSATPSQGTYDSSTGAWSVGNVASGGAPLTLQITATVASAGAKTNAARVLFSDELDRVASNNHANATVNGPNPAATPTTFSVSPTNRLIAPSFPLDRFFDSYDPTAGNGYFGVGSIPPNTQATLPATPTVAGLRGAAVPNAQVGAPIGNTADGTAFSKIKFTVLAAAHDTPFSMAVAGSVSFADAAQLDGVGALPTTTASPTRAAQVSQDPLTVTDFITTAAVSADLAVAKTDGKTTAVPGTANSYAITVTNNGPNTVTSVMLTDTLPATLLTPVFTPSAGVYDSTTHQWTGLNLATGQSVTMTLSGTIAPTATGQLINTVTVAPPAGITDPNPNNNTATDTDTLTPQVDLAVTKDDGKTTAVPGTANAYTITVSNAGPSTVTSVTLTDTLPAALLNPVFTPSAGAYDPNTHVWSGLTLAAGQSVTMMLSGAISATATGQLTNTVTVAPPAGVVDTNSNNDTATDTDNIQLNADLAVSKDDGKTTAAPGTANSYTIVVSNAGPSTVTSLTLNDTLPAALLNPVFTPSTGAYDPNTHVWSGLTLAAGQSVIMTLSGTIDPAAAGSLTNTVTVAPPAGTTDSNLANNTATDTDTLPQVADLAVTKDDGKTTATPGTANTYTMKVTNNGPSTLTSLTLNDTLPAALLNPVFTPSTGAYDSNSHAWTGLNLAAGQSVTMTLSGTIDPAATGSLTNTVTVAPPAGTTDNNPANNTATDTDTLQPPQADLAVTKDDGKTTAVPGTTNTYTMTVTNDGPSTLTSLTLKDTLPAALLNPVFTPSTGSYDSTTQLWTGLNLTTGQSATMTLTGTINPTATGTLVNAVRVTPPAGTTDPNPNNNTATDTDTLTPQADLAVTKSDGKTTVAPGAANAYAITVTNNGPSTVTSVTLTDTVPAALLTPVFTPSVGSYDSTTHVWTGLSLATGQSAIMTLSGTVDATATGNLTNAVTVNPPAGTTDPNPNNNSATDTDAIVKRQAALSGYVYADTNLNGVFDRNSSGIPTEIGLPNVTVTVSGAAVSMTTTTAPDGSYYFDNLPAGTYRITQTQPAGWIADTTNALGMILPGGATSGASTQNVFSNIVLPAAQDGVNYNFGENIIPTKLNFLSSADPRTRMFAALGVSNVVVKGTSGNDTIAFSATASQLSVTVNGSAPQQFARSSVHAITIDGGGGQDSVTLAANETHQVANLLPSMGSLRKGDDYTGTNYGVLVLNAQQLTANGVKGNNDFVVINDSAGNDALVSTGNTSTLTAASGQTVQVSGFDTVRATAPTRTPADNNTSKVTAIDFVLDLVGNWTSI